MTPAGTPAAKAAVTQPETADTVIFEGGKPLVGEVSVRGAKNLVTKAMVAALLADTPSTLKGVPAISDVAVVRGLLEAHAVSVTEDADGELVLDPRGVKSAHFAEIDAHAGSSRIPILFCGPLLHQLGEAFIPDLGGCRIGDRPINFHLDALRAFGAQLEKSYEGIRLKAPQRLVGARVDLPYPSVGATEQVLLTAVRAKGVTELTNAAIEPEIIDLIAILQKMGAIIVVEPNRTIVIEGVETLQGYHHTALADRNEAASWAAAVSVTEDADGELVLDPRGVKSAHFAEIDAHAGSSRIPILFCGPLLHQLGEAFIPDLGGCRIGDRPINFHLDALRAFGAQLEKSYEGIRLKAPQRLVGARVDLPYPSVGATEQVLLTAVRAKGVTELTNAAIEPEIIDLIAILQKMGAIIVVEPNRTIVIEGVETLQGYHHTALADRNEAASWAAAALATRGDIYVRGAKQQDLMTFLNVYRRVGGLFDVDDEGIRFRHPGEAIKPVVIETDVHPGFMTDWQQPMVVALTQAQGRSIVHETVYENRFGFTDALVQMGANIEVYKEGIASITRRVPRRPLEQAAVVTGPTPLHGANIRVPDLRGGFSHVIAAVTAQGTSEVSNIGIISRGYEHLLQKLDGLGVSFELGA